MFLSVRWGLEPPPSLLPGIVVATEEDSQPALWLKGDTFHPVTLYFGKKGLDLILLGFLQGPLTRPIC